MEKTSTSARLRQIMTERGLRQVDLVRMCEPYARECGISMGKSAISQYVSGKSLPAQRQLTVLGSALNVSEAWLMGYDVPRDRERQTDDSLPSVPDIFPIRRKAFPLLGEIACGEPTFAEEQHDTYVMAEDDIDADFCVRAKGDSMKGAHIDDGDIVFIKQMPMVDNGKIAAVLVEDETTLKRVDYHPESATLLLQPENPKYRTQIYRDDELNRIRILGQAVVVHKRLV